MCFYEAAKTSTGDFGKLSVGEVRLRFDIASFEESTIVARCQHFSCAGELGTLGNTSTLSITSHSKQQHILSPH